MADEIVLLLTCSNKKLATDVPVRADELYLGQMFKFGIRFADTMGWHVLILSAKLGWLERGSMIEPYDQRFTKPYAGTFPDGRGYRFGGQAYFKHCPARFTPLVTGARGLGDTLGLICAKQRAVDASLRASGYDPDEIRAANRRVARGESLHGGGVIQVAQLP